MSGRARQPLTSDLIITETILREESVVANSQSTFSITADLITSTTMSQLQSLNKLSGVTWRLNRKKKYSEQEKYFGKAGLTHYS